MRRASAAEGSCVHSHLVQTFGEGQHLTQLLAGGSRIPSYCTGAGKHPGRAPTERNPEHTYDGCHFYLNGEATLRFVGERMPALLDQLQPGLSSALGDIQWVVPHQVHAPPWACRACARVAHLHRMSRNSRSPRLAHVRGACLVPLRVLLPWPGERDCLTQCAPIYDRRADLRSTRSRCSAGRR